MGRRGVSGHTRFHCSWVYGTRIFSASSQHHQSRLNRSVIQWLEKKEKIQIKFKIIYTSLVCLLLPKASPITILFLVAHVTILMSLVSFLEPKDRPTDWNWKQVRRTLDRYFQASKAEGRPLRSLRLPFGLNARTAGRKWGSNGSKYPQSDPPVQASRLSLQMSYFQSVIWLRIPPASAELYLLSYSEARLIELRARSSLLFTFLVN